MREISATITYTDEKKFTLEQIEALYLSVGWVSAQYPKRLYKALMNSSTVFSAWDGERLVGLIRALDDSELVCYLHYLLVNPDYQGLGIARCLVELIKEKYRDYLYIELMPEDKNNVPFYERLGFQVMEGGTAMYRCNYSDKY